MRKLLLDANFLILPFQQQIDLFGEFDRLIGERYTVYTLNRTYNEAQDASDGKYRNLVKRLLEEADIEIIQVTADDPVDDVLIGLAGDYIIATNDRELRTRLRDAGKPHIYVRAKHHLESYALENAAFY